MGKRIQEYRLSNKLICNMHATFLQIKNRTDSVNDTSQSSRMLLEKLHEKLLEINDRYSVLKLDTLAQAETVADEAHDLADKAYEVSSSNLKIYFI